MNAKQKLFAVLAVVLASAVPTIASAQYNTFDPSAATSFRHGFWGQLGRDGERLLLGGVRYLTMPYTGPYPTNYAAPAGCPIGYVCIPASAMRQYAPPPPWYTAPQNSYNSYVQQPRLTGHVEVPGKTEVRETTIPAQPVALFTSPKTGKACTEDLSKLSTRPDGKLDQFWVCN